MIDELDEVRYKYFMVEILLGITWETIRVKDNYSIEKTINWNNVLFEIQKYIPN